MLALPQYHTPEGIAAIEVQLVETVREQLKDREWSFITTKTVPEIDTTATIGALTHGLPEIVFGTNFQDDRLLEVWRGHVHRLYTYVTMFGMPEDGEEIDPCSFYNFFADEHTPPAYTVDDIPPGNLTRLWLVKLDPGHWYMGEGWQHALHYNADEREAGEVWQWVIPDMAGRYHTDPNYQGFNQVLYETEPFGTRQPEPQTPERIARNRYMH